MSLSNHFKFGTHAACCLSSGITPEYHFYSTFIHNKLSVEINIVYNIKYCIRDRLH